MALGIIETILQQQEEIKGLLNQLLSSSTTAPEAAKKRGGKKAETVAEDAPQLPGGLVVTEVDVQPPVQAPVQQQPYVQPAVAPALPTTEPVNNKHVLATISTQLDMAAPQGTPNREFLQGVSIQWMNANGLNRDTLTMEHAGPLVDYCRGQLAAHLQQTQPIGGGL